MTIFNLLASNIIDLELKLEGKLPVDRDELLALVNSWGRYEWFCTNNKDGNHIKIDNYSIKEKYDLSKLDVSKISNFDSIFKFSDFEGNINSWDVSNGTSMDSMFYNTKEFNSPLDKWDVSNVTSMVAIFFCAEKFNSPLDNWNISKVKSISYMFCYTKEFNQALDKWNTSKVEDMDYMFFGAEKFNQDLNSLDISNVKDMKDMFSYTKAFNQPLLWDLSKIEKCSSMFFNAKAFMNKFNKDENLPRDTNEIKEWLKDNRNSMKAIEIKDNKSKDLDNFLLNLNVIVSKKLNGLHNNKEIYNENI